MNSAELIRIGQWFISGIDDGTILLHPFEEVIHDVISTLRKLKRKNRLLRVAMGRSSRNDESIHLNPGILRPRPADTSGSSKDLPGDQEGHKGPEAAPRKGETSRHEIVLVRSKGRIGFMIHIILDQRNRVGQTEVLNRILQQLIAGAVGGHHITERFTLR